MKDEHPTSNVQHPTSNGEQAPPNPKLETRNSKPLGRYFSIYAALAKNSMAREMAFKSNFILWIVVDTLWFVMQLCFISVLYMHTDAIGSWSKWEVILLIGASNFIQQIFHAFFMINLTNLSELVRTGKLDFLLLLPANTRFIISLRQLDLGGFVNAAGAACVMAYAAHKIPIHPTALQIGGFLSLCVLGILIHYSLMLLLASICFWTVKAQGIVWGYYNLFNIARLPDDAFKRGAFKVVFTFAIPMLLVSNVPARVLTDKLTSPAQVLLLLAMGTFCVIVSELGWRASLRHYTSASS